MGLVPGGRLQGDDPGTFANDIDLFPDDCYAIKGSSRSLLVRRPAARALQRWHLSQPAAA